MLPHDLGDEIPRADRRGERRRDGRISMFRIVRAQRVAVPVDSITGSVEDDDGRCTGRPKRMNVPAETASVWVQSRLASCAACSSRLR